MERGFRVRQQFGFVFYAKFGMVGSRRCPALALIGQSV